MPTPEELTQDLWAAIKSDRVMMLGLVGRDDAHTRPMTGQIQRDSGPIWFFTSTDSALWQQLGTPGQPARAIAAFVAKDHELFAAIHGTLARATDPRLIDELWNPFVAAWYDGKDDPKLALLRLDAEEAEVWKGNTGLLAAVKLMLTDPRKSFQDQVAQVRL